MFLMSTAAAAAFITAVGANNVFAIVDNAPSWTSVVNTALLIVLTLVARHNGQQASTTKDIAADLRAMVDEARKHAEAAAECSATTARIAKDVGRALRNQGNPGSGD